MKHKDSAAKMAAFPVNRGSEQQPSATRQKKAEAKKRKSPCTPFREKAKGKESDRRVLSRNRLSRADARATARSVIAPCPGLDRLVAAALDADLDKAVGAFNGSAEDRRIWDMNPLQHFAEETPSRKMVIAPTMSSCLQTPTKVIK